MYQIYSDQEGNVRTMIALLKKALPSRKENDWHIINNVRLRVLRTKNDFDNLNIEIEPCHFDPTFITEYNENTVIFFSEYKQNTYCLCLFILTDVIVLLSFLIALVFN